MRWSQVEREEDLIKIHEAFDFGRIGQMRGYIEDPSMLGHDAIA